MAAGDARTMWQRTASNCILAKEDTVRAPKLAHCPVLPKAQIDIIPPEVVRVVEHTPSYCWTNTWASMDTKTIWHLSPSAYCDYRSEYLGSDEMLDFRSTKPAGLQALAAECSGNLKGYSTGAELEWQWIVDPIPISGLGVSFHAAEAKDSNEKEEAANLNVEDNEQGFGENAGKDTSKTDLLTKKRLKESPVPLLSCDAEATEPSTMQGGIQQKENMDTIIQLSQKPLNDEQTVEMQGIQHHESMNTSTQLRGKSFIDGQCAEIFVSDFRKLVQSPATLASSVSWRTANKEALAALVAQKSAARLENCDLPTPLSKSLLKSSPQMVEPQTSQTMEQNLIASIFQTSALTHFESLELPASSLTLGRSETNSAAYQVPWMISQPLTIPTTHHASANLFHGSQSLSSTDNRNISWNPGGEGISSSLGKESGLFGEALCHSQTRAREAEKCAEQSFQDCKKLSHLFFREASLSLTYRQWISTLQAENSFLKMYMRNQKATVQWQQSLFSPFTAIDQMLRLQEYRNEHAGHSSRKLQEPLSAIWTEKECRGNFEDNHSQDGAEILMSCTLSLAFALGLSLASAGLMLGWSMGWILLAY